MLQISDNYDLSGSNTFRMKASCRRFISYDSIQDLASIRPDRTRIPHGRRQQHTPHR